ncbi:MAG: DNA polymerase III subunit delta [Chloroflexi bacterium RBG_13_51_18]|nr:MAG: DNA polymerase III subunit delta [Chloroflexi bacterium RBG_13_51_18]
MLHILIGENDFSLRQALDEIKKSIGDPAALMSNTAVLEGGKVTPEQLRSACQTVPFLADKRLVVIEGLLERFEPKGRVKKKKSSRRTGQSEDFQPLVESIRNLPPFTELVIIGGDIKAANPLLLELASIGKVRRFPMLKREDLVRWIEQRVSLEKKGAGISRKAIDLMVRLVGNDLWTMANEIDKLVLFIGERSIEEEDVNAVVSYAQEANVFNMVDAIIESRVSVAQELLQQLFQRGMTPAQILVLLSRQVRIIFQVREMRDRGISRGIIQTRLGLTSDFVLRKAWEQADKYTLPRLNEVYHKLVEADVSVKTGKYSNPELVLDILVAELGRSGAVSA